MPKYDYTLKVGEDGKERLTLLNEACNPLSLKFFNETVDLKNKNILEIGCGIGILAIEMAKLASPLGKVLATDISAEQLKVARVNAQYADIKNIKFLKISAYDINQLNERFDIIYLRLVLTHLPNVLELLQKIIMLMDDKSILICEESENIDAMFCEPYTDIFEKWKKCVQIQADSSKGNFTIGSHLPSFFSRNGLTIVKTNVVQPVLNTRSLKQQLWQGIIEITPLLITSGFMTNEEIMEMIHNLKHFANTFVGNVGLFKMRQIAAKKYSETEENTHKLLC